MEYQVKPITQILHREIVELGKRSKVMHCTFQEQKRARIFFNVQSHLYEKQWTT